MNIFGLLATAVICGATIAICWMLLKTGVTVHKTYEDVTKRPQVTIETPKEEKETIEKEKSIQEASLDAVIKAANEIMGIDVASKEDK